MGSIMINNIDHLEHIEFQNLIVPRSTQINNYILHKYEHTCIDIAVGKMAKQWNQAKFSHRCQRQHVFVCFLLLTGPTVCVYYLLFLYSSALLLLRQGMKYSILGHQCRTIYLDSRCACVFSAGSLTQFITKFY